VFIRHKRRHTQTVQGTTALRPCPLGVPREALRHEEVGDRKVTAPGPLESHDLPVVVDLHRSHGHHHAAKRGRRCATTDDPRRGADPLGMANAAGERPPPTDPVTALDGERLATGHKGPSGPGHLAVDKDLRHGLVRQKRAQRCNRRRPNERTPARRRINVRHRLQHLQLGDQVCFCPPKDGR
jgi:hypothetical protein